MRLTEAFVGLYNRLDKYLRRLTKSSPRAKFQECLALAGPLNTVVADHFADLEAFGQLRNFVEHQRGVTVVNWAEPTPEALALFGNLVEAITAPEPLVVRFASEIEVFPAQSPISEALSYMRENDYSQIVLSRDGTYPIMSIEGLARWLEKQAVEDLISIRETTVGDVAQHEPEWTTQRMSQKATVEDARRVLLRPQGDTSPRVFAIVVSTSGRLNEKPLAIVTPWDHL